MCVRRDLVSLIMIAGVVVGLLEAPFASATSRARQSLSATATLASVGRPSVDRRRSHFGTCEVLNSWVTEFVNTISQYLTSPAANATSLDASVGQLADRTPRSVRSAFRTVGVVLANLAVRVKSAFSPASELQALIACVGSSLSKTCPLIRSVARDAVGPSGLNTKALQKARLEIRSWAASCRR